MAASYVVVVGSDLRRTNVRTTAATHMLDILESACEKFHLDSHRYMLK